MKINGKKASPNEEIVVFPRPDEDIVFICKAVQDLSLFDKMCPVPQPPERIVKGQKIQNFECPSYKKSLDLWAEKKDAWLAIKSITMGTPGLEWEKVDLEKHTTWLGYKDELREFGLADVEINLIRVGVMKANSLSEYALTKARERFLASRQEPPAE